MKQSPAYEQAIVAFLDLLGFRRLVEAHSTPRRAEELISKLSATFHKFGESTRELRFDDKFPHRVSMFSDSVCFSMPWPSLSGKPREDCVSEFLFALTFGVMHLTRMGTMVRGGITIGYHAQAPGLIFSPAMIRAYDMEHREARFPRILVDEAIVQIVEAGFGIDSDDYPVKDYLHRDSDDLVFLNHLTDELINITRRDLLRWHKTMIESIAHQEDIGASVLSKCRWAMEFHNQRVQEYSLYRFDLAPRELAGLAIDLSSISDNSENSDTT